MTSKTSKNATDKKAAARAKRTVKKKASVKRAAAKKEAAKKSAPFATEMCGRRRLIVGVVGGDKNFESSREFGQEVTRRGWILLTGGQLRSEAQIDKEIGEVKEAAMLGAAEIEQEQPGKKARLIGVLPAPQKDGQTYKNWTAVPASWTPPSPRGERLLLRTGLPHYIRNVINGRTPDVLVAFGGGGGTLAEISFALMANKMVHVYRGFDRLSKNFEKYFGSAKPAGLIKPDQKKNRAMYLESPLKYYPGAARDVDALLNKLKKFFKRKSRKNTAEKLANKICKKTTISDESGFPGIPDEQGYDPTNKFHQYVSRMSR